MKNLLVIGGSYFFGRVLVETLAQNNDCRIYVVNRCGEPGEPSIKDKRGCGNQMRSK